MWHRKINRTPSFNTCDVKFKKIFKTTLFLLVFDILVLLQNYVFFRILNHIILTFFFTLKISIRQKIYHTV